MDIDIGFHIDKDWSKEQLEKSDFCLTIRLLEKMGFRSISFRLVKDFDFETGRELTQEESAQLPLYQVFQLYVDLVVDCIHPKIKQILGFVPIDEPLLSHIFLDKVSTTVKSFGRSIQLPKPQILLAMKLNSVTNRDKEHKRIKDIADIYALLWFSNIKIDQLKVDLFSFYPKEKARKIVRDIKEKEISRVSEIIGVPANEIKKVLVSLK